CRYQCLLWLVRPTNFGPSLASKIIFGGYDSQIRALVKDPNLPQHSWLSTDEGTVRRYTEDPLCGHDVSIDLWSSLLSNLSKLTDCCAVFGPKQASEDLVKVLVMGGVDDMCTERGKGVDQVRRWYPERVREKRCCKLDSRGKALYYPCLLGERNESLVAGTDGGRYYVIQFFNQLWVSVHSAAG
ncbi:hypothetical protein FOZ62_011046, partial [Perkinsus olseni]